jgi:hypothetical protein
MLSEVGLPCLSHLRLEVPSFQERRVYLPYAYFG